MSVRGDGVRLLNSPHVDGDHVLFAAVELLGKRQRGLGLADAGGTNKHEDADRLVRVVEFGAAGLDSLLDHVQPWRWPITRWLKRVGDLEDGLDLILTMRPTGMPVQSATTEATALRPPPAGSAAHRPASKPACPAVHPIP